jgi:hypothetical protein
MLNWMEGQHREGERKREREREREREEERILLSSPRCDE